MRSRGNFAVAEKFSVSLTKGAVEAIERVRLAEHESTTGGMIRRLLVEALRARGELDYAPRNIEDIEERP